MLYSGYSGGGLTPPPSRLSFQIGRDSAKLPFIGKNRQQYVSANANESRLLTWSSRFASWHQARGVITVRAASGGSPSGRVHVLSSGPARSLRSLPPLIHSPDHHSVTLLSLFRGDRIATTALPTPWPTRRPGSGAAVHTLQENYGMLSFTAAAAATWKKPRKSLSSPAISSPETPTSPSLPLAFCRSQAAT